LRRADCNSNPYSIADTNGYSHTYSDRYANALGNIDSNFYADINGYTNCYSYAFANTYGNEHAYTDIDSTYDSLCSDDWRRHQRL
jgi:hypothetical protein